MGRGRWRCRYVGGPHEHYGERTGLEGLFLAETQRQSRVNSKCRSRRESNAPPTNNLRQFRVFGAKPTAVLRRKRESRCPPPGTWPPGTMQGASTGVTAAAGAYKETAPRGALSRPSRMRLHAPAPLASAPHHPPPPPTLRRPRRRSVAPAAAAGAPGHRGADPQQQAAAAAEAAVGGAGGPAAEPAANGKPAALPGGGSRVGQMREQLQVRPLDGARARGFLWGLAARRETVAAAVPAHQI
jgi:hypothetical protein